MVPFKVDIIIVAQPSVEIPIQLLKSNLRSCKVLTTVVSNSSPLNLGSICCFDIFSKF